jgi:hypothetical protein
VTVNLDAAADLTQLLAVPGVAVDEEGRRDLGAACSHHCPSPESRLLDIAVRRNKREIDSKEEHEAKGDYLSQTREIHVKNFHGIIGE